MELTTSHDAWNGSCSQFNLWRDALAGMEG